LPIIQSCR